MGREFRKLLQKSKSEGLHKQFQSLVEAGNDEQIAEWFTRYRLPKDLVLVNLKDPKIRQELLAEELRDLNGIQNDASSLDLRALVALQKKGLSRAEALSSLELVKAGAIQIEVPTEAGGTLCLTTAESLIPTEAFGAGQ
ncbi:MAG: hypothetical protein IGS50_12405 [Synechococcales cyanobacterium C42_A2020_086]|jgi:hypothetical protein|nr:hypothetical protein [Synechococcales cyanobacterium C42_A2020_086]